MTARIVDAAKVFALLAVVFLCVSLGSTALRLGTTVQKVNANLDELQSTLVVTHKIATNARVTVDNINSAALDERFYFEKQMPKTLGQVNQVLDDTHSLLASATAATDTLNTNQTKITDQTVKVLKTTNETIGHVDLVLGQANNNLAQLEITEKHLDDIVENQDAVIALQNISSATGHFDATLADVQEEVHSITHPKPIVSVINWVLKVAHAVNPW